MQLTVLGNSNRYLSPVGAGLSYLLSAGGTHLVVDCANGTHLRLREALAGRQADGLILPHYHPESLADVLPVVKDLPPGAPVLVPRGSMPEVRRLLAKRGGAPVRTLRFMEVSEGSEETVGGIALRFARAHHGCHGVAFRAQHGGATLAWFGDTGYLPGLRAIAQGADLLVAHALILDGDEGDEARGTNLSAGAAARLASEAGARRLALAHMPFYAEAEASVAEARENFRGDVVVLEERKTYAIAPPAAVTRRVPDGAG